MRFKDKVVVVTGGGSGIGDRSNVGYGTMLAIVYLVLIVIAFTIFIKLVSRWMRPQY